MVPHHPDPQRILIIKLSALGDFVQALGLMRAIRHHHKDAHITLLTTSPYADLACRSGHCDAVIIDSRPRWTDIGGWLALRRMLREGRFQRVYDLQNNDRTALYFQLLKGASQPDWAGTIKHAVFRNDDPARKQKHAFDRHCYTLARAGIHDVTVDDLSWLTPQNEPAALGVVTPYILLVPGSAPSRPEKRWPAESYAQLAQEIARRGMQPVILGSHSEKDLAQLISAKVPATLDLCGRTVLSDIPALARGAYAAIGNDTGPMHMIAPTGCRSLVLFSRHSDPVRHCPRGANVRVMQRAELDQLSVNEVIAYLDTL